MSNLEQLPMLMNGDMSNRFDKLEESSNSMRQDQQQMSDQMYANMEN